jgi:hypothetical protein
MQKEEGMETAKFPCPFLFGYHPASVPPEVVN